MAAVICSSYRLVCAQHIEATDLEESTRQENPVRYHEAWQQLCSSDGVLVPGGFGLRGIEGKILAAEWARTKKHPFLGMSVYYFTMLCLNLA